MIREILFVCIILLAIYVHDSQENKSAIELSFCPAENCEEKLLHLLDQAKSSILCAIYDIDNPTLLDMLTKKATNISVEIITEKKNGKYAESFIVYDSNYALMHNKFCVIDGEIVWSGSANPTKNGLYKNNNALIFIDNAVIAKLYSAKAKQLLRNDVSKTSSKSNAYVSKDIELYFCPEHNCQSQVISEITAATKTIRFATFSFTDSAIATELILQHQKGIQTKGIIEKRMASRSVFKKLQNQNISVITDTNPFTMHHKFFTIDNKTTIIGSYNPSKNGNERNDENIVILHDSNITQLFIEEFETLFNKFQIQEGE